jgi:hypothetical protein
MLISQQFTTLRETFIALRYLGNKPSLKRKFNLPGFSWLWPVSKFGLLCAVLWQNTTGNSVSFLPFVLMILEVEAGMKVHNLFKN